MFFVEQKYELDETELKMQNTTQFVRDKHCASAHIRIAYIYKKTSKNITSYTFCLFLKSLNAFSVSLRKAIMKRSRLEKIRYTLRTQGSLKKYKQKTKKITAKNFFGKPRF